MRHLAFILAAAHFAAGAAVPLIIGSERCENITFTVRASATNIIVDKPSDTDLESTENVNAYLQALAVTVINGIPGNRTGTFRLAAVHCLPASSTNPFQSQNAPNSNPPLQILVHGATCMKVRFALFSLFTLLFGSHGHIRIVA